MYCAASMLPCGRYYYDPEGGYVGNPWVKFSYQYAYLYLAWIIHHLDRLDHYAFNYARTFKQKCNVDSIRLNSAKYKWMNPKKSYVSSWRNYLNTKFNK